MCDWTLYVNGVAAQGPITQNASQARLGNYPTNPELRMSKAMRPTDSFQMGQVGGLLHDVRIYARALSAGDIAALWTDDMPETVFPATIASTLAVGEPRVATASNLQSHPGQSTSAALVSASGSQVAALASASGGQTAAPASASTSQTAALVAASGPATAS